MVGEGGGAGESKVKVLEVEVAVVVVGEAKKGWIEEEEAGRAERGKEEREGDGVGRVVETVGMGEVQEGGGPQAEATR